MQAEQKSSILSNTAYIMRQWIGDDVKSVMDFSMCDTYMKNMLPDSVRYVHVDCTENEFSENYADLCFCCGTLEHVDDADSFVEKISKTNCSVLLLSYPLKADGSKDILNDISLVQLVHRHGFIITDFRFYNDTHILLKFENALPENLPKLYNCTGCAACKNICPVNAISMNEDEFGFQKPVLDENVCIHCDKCVRICPKLRYDYFNSAYTETYAARASDEIRAKSSSGGMFSVLADYVFSQNGVVFGVEMADDFSARYSFAENNSQLEKFRRSKYVESKNDCFKSIVNFAKSGRLVLFTGLPCQVAAVKNYVALTAPKFMNNIIFVDIVCHGVPSHKMLRDYLTENFDISKIKELNFRDKRNGWECSTLTLTLTDGGEIYHDINSSAYECGFHGNITLRTGCENCEFCGSKRVGDLTIGDAWGINSFDTTQNDGKGTSCVFINNGIGDKFFQNIKPQLQIKKVPASTFDCNRVHCEYPSHPDRQHFLDLYQKTKKFSDSVFRTRDRKFDVALVGDWSVENYGANITYYALYKVLRDQLGLDVLLVERPNNSPWKPKTPPTCFMNFPYPKYAVEPYHDTKIQMKQLNDRCDIFLVGSDQCFVIDLYYAFGKFIDLDWVYDYKPKIAYAASWGRDFFHGSEFDRAKMSLFMKKFDAFSVREKAAVRIAKDEFGVDADFVLDPVFLCCKSDYVELAKVCMGGGYEYEKEHLLFNYILDVDLLKIDAVNRASSVLGKKNVIMTDIAKKTQEDNDRWTEYADIKYSSSVEEWLANIIACDFMITDSFHGMCFAIIFHKPFVAIVNEGRGNTRFYSLVSTLGLENRLVKEPSEITEELVKMPIDWDTVDSLLQTEKEKSFEWLKNAIQNRKLKKPISEYDLLDSRADILEAKLSELFSFAEFCKTRFADIDNFAKGVNDRFAGIDNFEKGVNDRFAGIDNFEKGVSDRFTGLDNFAKGVNDRFAEADNRFNEINSLKPRINRLEKITGIHFLRKAKNFLKRKLPPDSMAGKIARKIYRKLRRR